ncbi:hypothetical protein LTR17_025939 [Elasticomyces elasticus]|nr:hypothetical protein LTR17_025939 [Elasticomyces elasticus]
MANTVSKPKAVAKAKTTPASRKAAKEADALAGVSPMKSSKPPRAPRTDIKSSDPAEDSAQDANLGSAESSADLQAISDAAPMNPWKEHHVYVVRPQGGKTEAIGQMMGYLNCATPDELYDLCHLCKDGLESVRVHQDEGYPDTSFKLSLGEVFNFGEKFIKTYEALGFTKDYSNWSEVLDCTDLDNDRTTYPIQTGLGKLRAAMIFLRHAALVIWEASQIPSGKKHFSGPAFKDRAKSICGLNTEDLSRFAGLIWFIKRKSQQESGPHRAKVDFLASCAPHARSGKSGKITLLPAVYKLSSGPAQPSSLEKATQQYALDAAALQRELAMGDAMGTRGATEDLAVIEHNDEIVNGLSFGNRMPKKRSKKGSKARGVLKTLPDIANDLRDTLINTITLQLQVLYDRTEAEARETALDGNSDALLEAGSANVLQDLRSLADESTSNTALAESETSWTAALAQRKGGSEAVNALSAMYGCTENELQSMTLQQVTQHVERKDATKFFQQFQDSINSVTATPPTFDETVKRFNLVVTTLPDGTPSVDHHGIKLLPHQVVVVGFLVDMLLSNLHAAILADETGLGKTIQSLVTDDKIQEDIRTKLEAKKLLATVPFRDFPPEKAPTKTQIAHSKRAQTTKRKRTIDSDEDDDLSEVEEDAEPEQEANEDDETGLLTTAYYPDQTRVDMDAAIVRNEAKAREIADAGLTCFKPSIVYAPTAATPVWVAEIGNLFQHRRLFTFLPAGSTSQRAGMGQDFLGNSIDLANYVKSLPVDDPATGNIIIVTSYTTAAARFLTHWMRKVSDPTDRRPITALSRQECDAAGIDPSQLDSLQRDAQALKSDGAWEHVYELRIPTKLFGVSHWDEAHKMKGVGTQQLHTLKWLKHGWVILLTASPFMRRLRDLTSLLSIVLETSLPDGFHTSTERSQITVPQFAEVTSRLKACGGSYLKASDEDKAFMRRALDPMAYDTLMAEFDDSPAIVRKVVPAPLGILALRRVTGQKIMVGEKEYIIAGDIPAFYCTFVELEPNAREYTLYKRAHKLKIGEQDIDMVPAETHPRGIDPDPTPLTNVVEDNDTEARENVDKRRRLQTCTNNAGLDNMYEYNVPANAKDVQKWYELHAGDNAAFAFYFHGTVEGWTPMPADRPSQLTYMTTTSSKTQYVIREAHRLQKEGKKLLVYCDWPSNVYVVKTALDTANMKAQRISAGQ